MKHFKKNIYRSTIDDDVVTLDPFDYMIVTYKYDPSPSLPDLDSATCFQNTGTIEDGKFVGCGQGHYATPSDIGYDINTAYLFQPGDDVSNGLGESIVISFKNLDAAGISLNNDVRVELYAGWCDAPASQKARVTVTTYTGGTMTLVDNTVVSDGTIIDGPFDSGEVPVIYGCCSTNPVTGKTHIGTIHFNLVTKVSSVIFY
jgi:hypothetical protein